MDVSTIRLEHKIAAVLACLRHETSYETAAQQLGVTAADVQDWEHTLLEVGGSALQDSAPDNIGELPGGCRQWAMEKANAVNLQLRAILDLHVLLETTLGALHESLGYSATISLIQGSDLLVKQASVAADGRLVYSDFRVAIADSSNVVAWVAEHGTSLTTGPDDTNPSPCELPVPIIAKGLVLGVLSVTSSTPGAFGQGDLDVLEAFTAQFSTTIDNALQFAMLQRR